MSHYEDAEALMQIADQAAVQAAKTSRTADPLAALPGLIGAVVHLLAAQVHSNLAIADEMQRFARRYQQ